MRKPGYKVRALLTKSVMEIKDSYQKSFNLLYSNQTRILLSMLIFF